VRVARRRQAQPLLQKDLARCGVEQVGAPHDVRDALVGVVDHDGQLVGEVAVGAQQHEVADLAREVLAESALHDIVEADGRGVDPQAPGAGRLPGWQAGAAGTRIDHGAIGRQCGIGQLPARAGAGIDEVVALERFQGLTVTLLACALHQHRAIPLEAAGVERAQNVIRRLTRAARLVYVLHAQQPAATLYARFEAAAERRDQRTEVQRPTRTGGKTADVK